MRSWPEDRRRLTSPTQTLCLGLFFASGTGYVAAQDATPASAPPPVRLHIDSQPLPQALTALATQTGVQLVYHPEDISAGVISPAVSGSYTADKALTRILDSSGLSFYHVNSNTIAIRMTRAEKPDHSARLATADSNALSADNADAASDSGGGVASGEVREGSLAQVVVSAEKREERLQDVPVPVSAISATELMQNNQVLLRDYYDSVPGLTLTPQSQSAQVLSIRGVTTGGGNPTVGVTVDDIPLGSSTFLGGGLVVPDIDPGDLSRIEVLRGPQGTLYGASSMGGLLKFVTTDPSTQALTGRVEVSGNTVHNGPDAGYDAHASVNIPLGDTFAMRASGFVREDPGYIDDPTLNERGVNEVRARGGRVSGLWKPSEDFSLKLSALIQDNTGDGSADVLPALGDLQQSFLRGTGGYDRKLQAYSATMQAKLGRFDLTSVTGYNVNQFSDSLDLTFQLSKFSQAAFGVPGASQLNDNRTGKFTQEIRLATEFGPHVDWLIGGFYTHENTEYVENIFANDPATGAQAGKWVYASFPTTFAEYAAFTDVTVHFTDQFDVQIGGRESQIKQTYAQTEVGPLVGGSANLAEVQSDGSAFTYLLTPRLKLSPDTMLYARLASGYRAGGPNASAGAVIPPTYAPDKTYNYEVGFKGDFLDHLLSVDASLYYIDWRNIQIQLVQNLVSYNSNGSRARSQGAEFSVQSRPVQGMRLAAWVAWNDAELTESFPATSTAFGKSGAQLPFSARFSTNFSLDQEFPLVGSWSGFAGGSVSYLGNRMGRFTSTAARQAYPGYAKTDLHLGVRQEAWTINLFVTNAADIRGVLTGGLGYYNPAAFEYIQPRTIGLSLTRTF